jgi:hypothetical protein
MRAVAEDFGYFVGDVWVLNASRQVIQGYIDRGDIFGYEAEEWQHYVDSVGGGPPLADTRRSYRLVAIDQDLNASAPSEIVTAYSGFKVRNLFPNPEFGIAIPAAWGAEWTRDVAPPCEFGVPPGCIAAAHFSPASTDDGLVSLEVTLDPDARRNYWSVYTLNPSGCRLKVYAQYNDELEQTLLIASRYYCGEFVRNVVVGDAPEDATTATICIETWNNDTDMDRWVTGFMVQPEFGSGVSMFGDGATAGWQWDATPHDSPSRVA